MSGLSMGALNLPATRVLKTSAHYREAPVSDATLATEKECVLSGLRRFPRKSSTPRAPELLAVP